MQNLERKQFLIRRAKTDEGESLTELLLRSKSYWGYSSEYLENCRISLQVDREYIRDWPVMVLESQQGIVLGFYALKIINSENRLDELWIDLPYIGKGCGSMLLKHALDQARQMGWTTLRLAAEPGAEEFYLRHGARRIGIVQSRIKPDLKLPHLEFNLADR